MGARPWLLLLVLVGCTEPAFRETACANGVDDDGDELRDCEDPDCLDVSGDCEVSLEACRDGEDSDRDGRTDCEDPRCIAAGHCGTFEVPWCDVRTGEGCPLGLGCYTNVGYTLYTCARPPEVTS